MSLFNQCFAGYLKDIKQYYHCKTVSHTSDDCPQKNEGEENVPVLLLHSLETLAAALFSGSGHFCSQKGWIPAFITNIMSRIAIMPGASIVMSICYAKEIFPRHWSNQLNQPKGKGGAWHRGVNSRPYGPYYSKQKEVME